MIIRQFFSVEAETQSLDDALVFERFTHETFAVLSDALDFYNSECENIEEIANDYRKNGSELYGLSLYLEIENEAEQESESQLLMWTSYEPEEGAM